jgi:hypothetical protein
MDFQQLFIGAVFIESLVKVINMAHELYKDWRYWASLVVGVAVAVVFGLDIFAAAGFQTAVPFMGAVLTGVMLSRGANFVHDILKAVQGGAAKLAE